MVISHNSKAISMINLLVSFHKIELHCAKTDT